MSIELVQTMFKVVWHKFSEAYPGTTSSKTSMNQAGHDRRTETTSYQDIGPKNRNNFTTPGAITTHVLPKQCVITWSLWQQWSWRKSKGENEKWQHNVKYPKSPSGPRTNANKTPLMNGESLLKPLLIHNRSLVATTRLHPEQIV